MSQPTRAESGVGSEINVQLFRVKAGTEHFVLMLSPKYGGMFTHHVRQRSQYCAGDGECNPAVHRLEKFWKGYAAAAVFDRKTGLWVPWVLELTEHAELFFRDRYKRGQVWRMYRLPEATKHKTPVEAELVEEREPAKVRPAFDILPVLQTIYHVGRISLTTPNPTPAKTFLAPTPDEPPPGFGARKAQEERASAEDWQRLRESIGGVGTEVPKNGHRK